MSAPFPFVDNLELVSSIPYPKWCSLACILLVSINSFAKLTPAFRYY